MSVSLFAVSLAFAYFASDAGQAVSEPGVAERLGHQYTFEIFTAPARTEADIQASTTENLAAWLLPPEAKPTEHRIDISPPSTNQNVWFQDKGVVITPGVCRHEGWSVTLFSRPPRFDYTPGNRTHFPYYAETLTNDCATSKGGISADSDEEGTQLIQSFVSAKRQITARNARLTCADFEEPCLNVWSRLADEGPNAAGPCHNRPRCTVFQFGGASVEMTRDGQWLVAQIRRLLPPVY